MLDLAVLRILGIPLTWWLWWHVRDPKLAWWLPVGLQLSLALVAEPLALWLMFKDLPNHTIYNLYMILEFGALSWLVMNVPRPSKQGRTLAKGGALLFLISLIWQISASELNVFFHTSLMVGGSLLAFQAILALHRLAEEQPVNWRSPELWILASMVLYFLSATPVLAAVMYFTGSDLSLALFLLDLNDGLFVARYALVALGLAMTRISTPP